MFNIQIKGNNTVLKVCYNDPTNVLFHISLYKKNSRDMT